MLAPTLAMAPVSSPPAAAATTSLSLQGRIDHRLSGIYNGDSPAQAYASPAFADITGDNTPELVIGSMDGTVEAYRATDRSRLWSVQAGTCVSRRVRGGTDNSVNVIRYRFAEQRCSAERWDFQEAEARFVRADAVDLALDRGSTTKEGRS